MMGKTHAAAGTLIGLTTSTILLPLFVPGCSFIQKISCTIISIVVGRFGGKISDIDEPGSSYGRKFWFITWPFLILRFILAFIAEVFLFGKLKTAINKIVTDTGHRYLTHSFCMLGLSGAIMFWIRAQYFSSFGFMDICGTISILCLWLGILSHILLDMIAGTVPIFSPFTDKRFKLPIQITENSIVEDLFRIAINGFSCLYIYMIYFHRGV